MAGGAAPRMPHRPLTPPTPLDWRPLEGRFRGAEPESAAMLEFEVPLGKAAPEPEIRIDD
jgi:hypothetical protein